MTEQFARRFTIICIIASFVAILVSGVLLFIGGKRVLHPEEYKPHPIQNPIEIKETIHGLVPSETYAWAPKIEHNKIDNNSLDVAIAHEHFKVEGNKIDSSVLHIVQDGEIVNVLDKPYYIPIFTFSSATMLSLISDDGNIVIVYPDDDAYDQCTKLSPKVHSSPVYIEENCISKTEAEEFHRIIQFFIEEEKAHPDETAELLMKLKVAIRHKDGSEFGYVKSSAKEH